MTFWFSVDEILSFMRQQHPVSISASHFYYIRGSQPEIEREAMINPARLAQ
jgi:hypothetical protein